MATLQERESAHAQVAAAVRCGDLQRPAVCADCNQPSAKALHGHHEDYSRPLDVIWLCNGCHRKRHSDKRDLVKVGFFIPKSLDRAIEIEKARRDVTKQALVEAALCAYIEAVGRRVHAL